MTNPDPEPTIEAMREAASALRSVTVSPAKRAKALRTLIDSATAQLSFVLREMDEMKLHEAEGASSLKTWAHRELGQDSQVTSQLLRNATTMNALPAVAEAALAGRVNERHVNALTFSLKHIGEDETVAMEVPLLTVASLTTPRELFAKIREVRAVQHPDALDEAWLAGMDKEDISLTRLPDGWFLTGHLSIETGGKLDVILRNLSVPRTQGDDRSPAQRRVDGFDALLEGILQTGLPTDDKIRPHLMVTAEAQTVKSTYAPTEERPAADPEAKPIDLHGFGPIGPNFAQYLLCQAEITPILINTVNGKVEVLDVGRDERYATTRQAKGIWVRQGGRCATPGCHHPINHNHHVIWWEHGGTTAMDAMVGLCRKCHALVHDEQLNITGTYREGFVFTNARGTPLPRAA